MKPPRYDMKRILVRGMTSSCNYSNANAHSVDATGGRRPLLGFGWIDQGTFARAVMDGNLMPRHVNSFIKAILLQTICTSNSDHPRQQPPF